ncbi:hypothetical protein NDI56_13230 [Haloarcula sp. S1CR25-12]|uniref:Peptidase M50 n=1 Tax=Haloarcula saliterrae TaxID=2950534 RepID=A0ABU2FF71_9EURY|nr:hypothetical protein [Haloarcula sp. S1CR25-12]MDS0260360.1 hypothetical protein [Haloarcula sp. S1CR25-12]
MEREVEHDDTAYGFVWGTVDGTYFLREPDGGFRTVNRAVVDLLTAVARGSVPLPKLREQADGGTVVVETAGTTAEEALALVESYIESGVFREGDPVVRLVPPAGVRLWPRVGLFVCLVAVVAVGVAHVLPSLSSAFLAGLTVVDVVAAVGLAAAYVAVHELGHYAVSAHHFDPSIRVDLVNGVLPAVVTDTTGAWMLPRSRRVWVNLAGPLLELVAALPLVALAFLDPGSRLVTLVLLTVAGHVVFALNPLIHGDGYWIVCDWLGLENVRTDGIEDLRNRRLSWRAAYVTVSYAFGVGLLVNLVWVLTAVSGLLVVVPVVGLGAVFALARSDIEVQPW